MKVAGSIFIPLEKLINLAVQGKRGLLVKGF